MKKTLSLVLFSVFILICHSALFAQVEDMTPPVVQSLDFTPKTVDVSGGPQTITVTLRITDALSGFFCGGLSFTSPSQKHSVGCAVFQQSLQSGDIRDGVYQTFILIPQNSEAGEYQIGSCFFNDNVGNSIFYSGADFAALGFPTIFNVTGGMDLTPPKIAYFNFTPQTVDVSGGPQTITVTLRITDALSGFFCGSLSFTSPSQQHSVGCAVFQQSLQSGDIRDGVYQTVINIPQYCEAGEWQIGSCFFNDNVGNSIFYSGADFAALGFPTKITVLSNPEDLKPPAVQNFNLTPQTVPIGGGPQNITVTLRITDALSGYRDGALSFTSPSQKHSVGCAVFQQSRTSGDMRDGVYQTVLYFPQYSELGEWQIGSCFFNDNVGNSIFYSGADFAALGFPTTLMVTNNQNPVAEAGPDKTALIKEMVQFDGGSSKDPDGYIAAYAWDFGDGSAAGFSVTHAYTQSGQFTVTLRVTDNEGATAADQLLVVVKAPSTAVNDLLLDVKNNGVASDIQTSLMSKLNGALDALNKKNDTAAVNKLKAFINEVEAQKGKKIPAGVAGQWTALASRIIASIQAGPNSLQVSALGAPVNITTADRADSPREIDAENPGFVVRVRAEEAGPITVAITDAKGNPVGMVFGRYEKAGDYVLLWDGRDQEGNSLPKGNYSYQVLGSSKPGRSRIIVIR